MQTNKDIDALCMHSHPLNGTCMHADRRGVMNIYVYISMAIMACTCISSVL